MITLIPSYILPRIPRLEIERPSDAEVRKGFGAEGVYEVFSGEAEDTRGGYEITGIIGTEVWSVVESR
jgi:hypothetical protein